MLPESSLEAGALSVYRNLNPGSTGAVVKADKTALWSLVISNIDTKFVCVKLYNKATAPTGSDTPTMTIPVNTVTQVALDFTDPVMFPLGLGIRATGLVADNDTTAPTASTCIVNLGYK